MRRYRAIILVVLVGVLPLIVAIFVVRFSPSGNESEQAQHDIQPVLEEVPAPTKSVTYKVLVAAQHLPIGTLLSENDLTEVEVGAGAVQPGSVVPDSEMATSSLHGYVVRHALAAGSPVTWANVVGPGQRGFLAAVLKPGTRAVTIRLDPATQHAALIDPGDRVDVILATNSRSDGTEAGVFPRDTIVENVQVVAVDNQIMRADKSSEDGEQIERDEIETATLEVSPAQAELLVFGEQQGEFRLTVRSIAAAGSSIQNEAVGLQEYLPEAEEWEDEWEDEWEEECVPKTVRIIRGSAATEETFVEHCVSSKEHQTQAQGVESEL